MREKYESLSATVLRDLAKSRGIKSTYTMKKADLVEAMLAEDAKKEKEKAAKESEKNRNSQLLPRNRREKEQIQQNQPKRDQKRESVRKQARMIRSRILTAESL